MSDDLADLEFELRLLPGVLGVGVGPVEPTGHVSITVVAVDPDPHLKTTAVRTARGSRGQVDVEVVDLSAPGGAAQAPPEAVDADERVALVSSVVESSGETVVVLAWMGRTSRGTATAGPLIGPAAATLQALEGLGVGVKATLGSVSSGQGVANPPIRVILRSPDLGIEFVGVARAHSEPESAARATLAAFNRYVAGHRIQLN